MLGNRTHIAAGHRAGEGGVTRAQAEEIRRLYQWVVLNLGSGVAADVRAFLLKRALTG